MSTPRRTFSLPPPPSPSGQDLTLRLIKVNISSTKANELKPEEVSTARSSSWPMRCDGEVWRLQIKINDLFMSAMPEEHRRDGEAWCTAWLQYGVDGCFLTPLPVPVLTLCQQAADVITGRTGVRWIYGPMEAWQGHEQGSCSLLAHRNEFPCGIPCPRTSPWLNTACDVMVWQRSN